MAKKEMDNAQILRHLEDDMGDLLGLFDIPDVYEIMLNAFKRQDGSYEGHIWYEQSGKGMVRLFNSNIITFSRYPVPAIGDKVFAKYFNNQVICHHVINDDKKEILESMGMVLKTAIKEDANGVYFLEQEEHYRLCDFADYLIEAQYYGHKRPVPDGDIEDIEKFLEVVNHELSRVLIGISFDIRLVTITAENIEDFRHIPKYLLEKDFVKMTSSRAMQIMNILAATTSKHFHDKEPRLECAIPFYHHRFTGQIPPFVKFPSFTIRKHSSKVIRLDEYVKQGIMPETVAETIRVLIKRGCNILIGGGTGSGKTTLINSLLREMAEIHPESLNRIGIIEDTPEIQNPIDNAFEFAKTNEVTMDEALVSALRSRPNSIIVGELRGKEGYTLFKAMLTGHTNCMGTIHATGSNETLVRFEQCIKEHPDCKEMPIQRDQVASALNAVISIQRRTLRIPNKTGTYDNKVERKVTALAEITGYDPNYNVYEWIPYYMDKEAVLEQKETNIVKAVKAKYQ